MSEPALTLTGGEVAEAAGGRVVRGDAAAPFGVFGIDSRAIVSGSASRIAASVIERAIRRNSCARRIMCAST